MSMYKQFANDESREQNGIVLDYGDFQVTIARAGGSNKRYSKILEAKARPYQRAIATETIAQDVQMRILRETFAEAVVLKWATLVNGELKDGIEGPDGKLLPVTVDNIVDTFNALPDLFNDIRSQAERASLFRSNLNEALAKN